MTELKDYYALLGLAITASADEVKKAYRALARACHPDRNPGDHAAMDRFRGVQEAYEVLSDPRRRRQYDDARQNPLHAEAFAVGATVSFSNTFGGGAFFHATVRRAQVWPDIPVRLTFEQALSGGSVEVRLPGGGSARVEVPRGVRSGARLPVPDAEGPLRVLCEVAPSERFRRDGDHLLVVEPVSALEACVGTARTIHNAYGKAVTVEIPPGTQPGERLRLRGQGVHTDAGAGDLFVEVRLVVPKDLTDEQRRQIADCGRSLGLL